MIATRRQIAVWAAATAIGAGIPAAIVAPQSATDEPTPRAVVSGVVCHV